MTTYIFDTSGRCVSQSHNLAGLYTWARKSKGVSRLECHVFPETDASYSLSADKTVKASRPTGYLIARLRNGYRVETWFACGSHLQTWAQRVTRPRVNSWFSGAAVEVKTHAKWVNLSEEVAA